MTGGQALPAGQALPKFFAPGRRGRLTALAGISVTAGLLAAGTARLVSLLSHGHDPAGGILLVGGLVGLVAATFGLRVFERRLAEEIGQDYVHEIRKELIRGALGPDRSPSLGITIARTSNDLNSVRNWITHGIAGAVSGIPLILILTASLWLMAPPLALAVMVPLIGAVTLLAFLSRPTYDKARALRKARGRLAGQITDTVNAATAVRAAGGQERELGRVDRLGREVAAAAIDRATLAGSLRASAIGAASTTAVAVAATGAFTGMDSGLIAAALTVVGMIAAPIHDLGRIVEYRQSYRAACRSIAPALSRPAADTTLGNTVGGHFVGLSVAGLDVDGTTMPGFSAAPGETILLETPDHAHTEMVFAALLGLHPAGLHPGTCIVLNGKNIPAMTSSERRQSIGYAARGLALERGQAPPRHPLPQPGRRRRPVRDRHQPDRAGCDNRPAAQGRTDRAPARRGTTQHTRTGQDPARTRNPREPAPAAAQPHRRRPGPARHDRPPGHPHQLSRHHHRSHRRSLPAASPAPNLARAPPQTAAHQISGIPGNCRALTEATPESSAAARQSRLPLPSRVRPELR
ncbi:ABC transporter transmembrane domain-containing protein [Pseudarthrobacter sp. Fe7]|nr:ABC transporter transmembrane domain-containing protein [Pseudarthrobacter sp. Fe7]